MLGRTPAAARGTTGPSGPAERPVDGRRPGRAGRPAHVPANAPLDPVDAGPVHGTRPRSGHVGTQVRSRRRGARSAPTLRRTLVSPPSRAPPCVSPGAHAALRRHTR